MLRKAVTQERSSRVSIAGTHHCARAECVDFWRAPDNFTAWDNPTVRSSSSAAFTTSADGVRTAPAPALDDPLASAPLSEPEYLWLCVNT